MKALGRFRVGLPPPPREPNSKTSRGLMGNRRTELGEGQSELEIRGESETVKKSTNIDKLHEVRRSVT